MTVPINIPIITTSPPTVKSAKSFIKPERSGDFEQILKQITSETSQADNEILQNDHAVKVQPQNNIESEVKSTRENTKSEKIDEESKPSNQVNENVQPQLTCQLAPTVVPTQNVPVLSLNSNPVDQTKQEVSSETKVDQLGEGVSGTKTPGGSNPQQTQSALSALPGEPVMNGSGTDKTGSMINTEAVKGGEGKDTKEVKAFDPSFQTQGNDPSVSQSNLDSRFGKASQSLSSVQDSKSIDDQGKGFVAPLLNEATEGPILNQNEPVKSADPVSKMINGEHGSKQGLTGVANEKGFTSSANVGQDPEIKGEILPKTEGQPAGLSSVNKVLAEEVKAVAGIKGVSNAGKPERKMVQEAPPDSPDKAPPASTPGVVTDRMKADPFTGKINEPARLAEAQTTEILRQISRQIAGSSSNGSQTIRIQLHPEDLGQIELRITSSSQGTQVSLIADQAGTSKLLETHIAQLKQTLSDAGVQMANVHVGQQAPQQSFRDPQSNQSSPRHNTNYDNRNKMGTDEIVSNQSRSNNSLVDYRI